LQNTSLAQAIVIILGHPFWLGRWRNEV